MEDQSFLILNNFINSNDGNPIDSSPSGINISSVNNVPPSDLTSITLVKGCTDPNSPIYNPLATVDDGSCIILNDIDNNTLFSKQV